LFLFILNKPCALEKNNNTQQEGVAKKTGTIQRNMLTSLAKYRIITVQGDNYRQNPAEFYLFQFREIKPS
jgi:hypothetical protein